MNRYARIATLYILISLILLLLILSRDFAASGALLYLPLMGRYK